MPVILGMWEAIDRSIVVSGQYWAKNTRPYLEKKKKTKAKKGWRHAWLKTYSTCLINARP
jgi:hypothetical protein